MNIQEIETFRGLVKSSDINTSKLLKSSSSSKIFEDATYFTKAIFKNLIIVSENYLELLALFPENTKEGFGTQSLPSIWENKDEFNALMQKSSDDMIKLASLIEESEDIRGTLKQYMWNNCNACHSKFRKPH